MVRIKDIANELGVSSTTVSNVIHGKAKKASPELVAKIQEVLERENYVPNMAGVLLSQSSSNIIAVVLSNDICYGDKMLQDPFVSEMLSGLESCIQEKGYFTMLHNTKSINDVVRMAAMWNVAGLVLLGFCKEDYENLRKKSNVPFVSVDGYFDIEADRFVNVGVDDNSGGYMMAKELIKRGHTNIVYMADNHEGCQYERMAGVNRALLENGLEYDIFKSPVLPADTYQRKEFFEKMADDILDGRVDYSALFFGADAHAIEAMNVFQDKGISIPDDISIAGFDDTAYASVVRPYLTTVRQDILLKSVVIINTLMNLVNGYELPTNNLRLPVEVVLRESLKDISGK